jgi:large subunit ribosomal protein L22
MIEDNKIAKASAKYLRLSPKKARRVLNQIRGYSYQDALMILEFMPYRACNPIWQVLNSAVANAENNLSLNRQNLIIKSAFVDKGPTLKRFRPRAQGKGFPIKKPTCHISISLTKNN